jgi:hypothetical protein
MARTVHASFFAMCPTWISGTVIHDPLINYGEFWLSFNVEPYHGYGVGSCGDLTGTNWVALIILDPPPDPTDATWSDHLTSSDCSYRVVTR